MGSLTLLKSRTRPGNHERVDTVNEGGEYGVLRSAVWQIRELPGIFLISDKRQGGRQLWRVRYHAVCYQREQQALSRHLEEKLRGQLFASRREALQALEVGALVAQVGAAE